MSLWWWAGSGLLVLAAAIPVLSVRVIGNERALGELADRVQSLLSQLDAGLDGADPGMDAVRLADARRCATLAHGALARRRRPGRLRIAEQWARQGLAALHDQGHDLGHHQGHHLDDDRY